MNGRRTVPITIAMLAAGFPAVAADCPIERAIYAEAEAKIEIRFRPAASENTPVSHRFTLVAPGGKMNVDGHVLYDPEIERPVAMAMHNCPEGDVTGAEIAACTIWKGIIYSADKAGGDVNLLPDEGADAPASLVLPGFGPAIAASSFGGTLNAMPWDVFVFKGCAS